MLTTSPMPANGVSRLLAEVWLEIIPHIPYSPQDLTSLRLTCVTLNGLVKHHEHSLVTDIKAAQFRRDSTQLFPGLALKTYANLSTLHRRLETLEELHGQWLEIVNHGVELHWLKGRWESIHKAGLLLLYRLLDAGTYEAKVKLLEQLPATSLACLLFKLISSIKILRVFGPEPINATYCKQDAMVRSDVELAFEELLLQHGPQMFAVMLKAGRLAGVAEIDGGRSERAVSALQAEVSGMESRQHPFPDGQPKPPTLISSLRRVLAAKAEVGIALTVSKMWELLSGTAFDEVDSAKMVKLVRGEEIEKGRKRVGF